MAQDPQAGSNDNSLKLNNGLSIPQLGFGTYKLRGLVAMTAVEMALSAGYRHVDTAIFYGNEEMVGQAIKKSKVDRKDVFVTSKLWGDDHGKDRATRAVKSSLKKMGLAYIDLYLIHSPIGGKNVETYKVLLDFQKQGKVKSVGVSNFGVKHLEALEKAGLPLPCVNQVELHPWLQQKEIVQYCRKKGIVVEAYSVLAKGQKLVKQGSADTTHNKQMDQLLVMASKYDKTPAQILVKWSLQTGHVCLVKSGNPDRIQVNFKVFDWKLSDEDMQTLNSYDEDYHCTWDPTTMALRDF